MNQKNRLRYRYTIMSPSAWVWRPGSGGLGLAAWVWRPGSGGLPEGTVGWLHHRRRPGRPADGGPRRTPPAARPKKQLAAVELLIIDELGFVPLSETGAELLFEMISQRYERGATLITSNLPLDQWTEIFGTERLTGALLDRLAHHVDILETNGDSYRLAQSRTRKPTEAA